MDTRITGCGFVARKPNGKTHRRRYRCPFILARCARCFSQPLPPEVLLVNRASIGTAFRDWLAGPAHELTVRAPSALEVVAVFAAWVQTLPTDDGDAISSRAIIIE